MKYYYFYYDRIDDIKKDIFVIQAPSQEEAVRIARMLNQNAVLKGVADDKAYSPVRAPV